MTTILTKTAKDGRIIEIKKVGYDHKVGATIAAFIGSERIAHGWPTDATVNGRPEITYVFAGKIGLTEDEMTTINAAFSAERDTEMKNIEKRIAYEDNRRMTENA